MYSKRQKYWIAVIHSVLNAARRWYEMETSNVQRVVKFGQYHEKGYQRIIVFRYVTIHFFSLSLIDFDVVCVMNSAVYF